MTAEAEEEPSGNSLKSSSWRKLQELTKDLGARRRNLQTFLEDELCTLWHIDNSDRPAVVFAKVVWQLERLIRIAELEPEQEPESETNRKRLVLRVNFNIAEVPDIEPRVKAMKLMARRQWLADKPNKESVSISTSQRFLIDALDKYEDSLEESPPPPVPEEILAKIPAYVKPAVPEELQPAPPSKPGIPRPLLISAGAGLITLVLVVGATVDWKAFKPGDDNAGSGVSSQRTSSSGALAPVSAGPGPSLSSNRNTSPAPAVTGKTYTQISGNKEGTRVFNDPRRLSREIARIPFMQSVEVSCRAYVPSMLSVTWWYRLASPPYNNEWWSPAVTFLNGDKPEGPYEHDVDEAVPVCV